jgi:hypothetical protein
MDDAQIKAEEDRQERYLRWADWAGWVLVSGLVVELVYALFSDEPLSKIIWILIADALVIGGVAGELQFGRRAKVAGDKVQTEMKSRLASASDRAAQAEAALIEFRKPRLINPSDRQLIARELTPFSGTYFDIGMGEYSGEQQDFVWELEPALWDAGWKQDDWAKDTPFGRQAGGRPWRALVWASNVEIHLHRESRAALLPASEALVAVLNELGITAYVRPIPNVWNDNPRAIHIAIGVKV